MRLSIVGLSSLLLACIATAGPKLGDEFTLRVGERAAITALGLSLRFIQVVGDSRCPADAVCTWAGDGAVLIEVAPLNGDAKEDTVHTTLDPHSIPLGRAQLQLVRLAPYPVSSRPIAPGEYTVTLVARMTP